jgi:exopolysaccharide biosynthesis polyprenyl glycosylphosphotransferase
VGLKARLVLTDLAGLTIGWIGVLWFRTVVAELPSTLGPHNVGWAMCAMVINLVLLMAHNLYLARVCSVRAVELQGLGRSVLGTCLALLALERLLRTELLLRELWIAGLVTFALLAVGRAAFTAWLRHERAAGRFVRGVLIVGADPDAAEIVAVMREHPEFGFRACGYVGDPGLSEILGAPHQGAISETVSIVKSIDATGVVIVPSAVESEVLNDLVRRLLASGVHVHLSSGLRGIAHRRFRATPLAYEPLFYVEPASLTPRQMLCKRTIDLIGSVVGLVVTAPVLAVAMVVIKLDSPGPVLFRQQRVGRNGQCFEFLKLRTMVRNAEAQRARLESHNHRTSGPLFKAADDPRITRVGRVLRATSLDELPQLWNVLRGSMSLVGPRPALPSEVVQFDERLQTRTRVAPGLTGLWQIEARDNPSFGPYRRLDLFYVENWSPLLDIGIIVTTVARVIGRAMRMGRPGADVDAPNTIVLD